MPEIVVAESTVLEGGRNVPPSLKLLTLFFSRPPDCSSISVKFEEKIPLRETSQGTIDDLLF